MLAMSRPKTTPEILRILARFLGDSARFWMNLQTRYDITVAEMELGERIEAEVEQVA